MVGVCTTCNVFKRRVCCLCSSPLAIQYLPSRCVVSSVSQALARAARENGRKSDPYGGTIKLTADLQSSSKPGQDFINTRDWHPPFTHGHCALNFLLSPQQHQCLTPGCLRTDPQSCFFFFQLGKLISRLKNSEFNLKQDV